MKQTEVYSLGQTFNVSVPESESEFDQLAKKQGACVDSANSNVIYRSYLPDWRPAFVEYLESESEVKREVDAEGNPTGEDKSENAYANRVYASLAKSENVTPDVVRARFAGKAQELANAIAFDPSKKERSGGGSNLVAKTYIKWASEAFDAGKINLLADKLAQFGFALSTPLTGDREADVLAVAKVIAAREAKKREEAKGELAV